MILTPSVMEENREEHEWEQSETQRRCRSYWWIFEIREVCIFAQ